jgi:hypothetical protein
MTLLYSTWASKGYIIVSKNYKLTINLSLYALKTNGTMIIYFKLCSVFISCLS